MRLIKLGVLLAILLAITLGFLAFVYNTTNGSGEGITGMTIGENFKTIKEQICSEREDEIKCEEKVYLIVDGKRYDQPLATSYIMKEKVIVPQFIEKERIVLEEKKLTGEEKEGPADRIKDADINVFGESVRIDIKNAKWRRYIDSNSMDPLIDEDAITIEIRPKNANEIKIGDILAYRMEGYGYAFVHRVIEIGDDENGAYFITKGDNYYKEDPDKVRFSQIEGIVVGILY